MTGEERKLQKPQLRGLLHSQIKRNLILTATSCLIGALYMKFVFGDGRKAKYAEFFKDYDAEAEFDQMRKKGLFDSCDAD